MLSFFRAWKGCRLWPFLERTLLCWIIAFILWLCLVSKLRDVPALVWTLERTLQSPRAWSQPLSSVSLSIYKLFVLFVYTQAAFSNSDFYHLLHATPYICHATSIFTVAWHAESSSLAPHINVDSLLWMKYNKVLTRGVGDWKMVTNFCSPQLFIIIVNNMEKNENKVVVQIFFILCLKYSFFITVVSMTFSFIFEKWFLTEIFFLLRVEETQLK